MRPGGLRKDQPSIAAAYPRQVSGIGRNRPADRNVRSRLPIDGRRPVIRRPGGQPQNVAQYGRPLGQGIDGQQQRLQLRRSVVSDGTQQQLPVMNQVAVLPDGLIIEAVFLHDMNHPLRIRFQAAKGALPLLEQ
ncbi:hypothetical protein D3C76_1025460 [compost metagenome]